MELSERLDPANLAAVLDSVCATSFDSVMVTEVGEGVHETPIVYVNDAFTELTGYERADVLGKSPAFLQGPGTEREVLDRLLTKRELEAEASRQAAKERANDDERMREGPLGRQGRARSSARVEGDDDALDVFAADPVGAGVADEKLHRDRADQQIDPVRNRDQEEPSAAGPGGKDQRSLWRRHSRCPGSHHPGGRRQGPRPGRPEDEQELQQCPADLR